MDGKRPLKNAMCMGFAGRSNTYFYITPYLRVLLMDFKNQLHENDFSFGAEKHFFSSYSDGKSVFGWKSWLKEAGKPAFPALFL